MLKFEKIKIDKKVLDKSIMIKEYKDEMIKVIKSSYPDIDEDKLKEIIEIEVNKIDAVPIVNFNNNYTKKNRKVTLLAWYDWYKKKKPITTEHGVCFKRHDESINLSAKLLEYILDTRKYHKKEMFNCKKALDSIGEKFHNIRQKVFKIFANSYYGATGMRQSVFYNLFTALSITGKGQSLITNAAMNFEQFFVDNVWFDSIDDVYIFINNIKNEKRNFKDGKCLTKQVKKNELIERLIYKFSDINTGNKYRKDIENIVNNLSKQDINRIYYKNNFYDFCSCPKVLNKVFEILDKVDSFDDPNEVPEEIKDDCEELWTWQKEFVYYSYPVFNRISKCKHMVRKTVVTVDTDSNMINIEPWIDFLIEKSSNKYDKDNENDICKMVNLMAFTLDRMLKEVHEKYTADCNVPKDKRPIINMKNEFLNRRMVLTSSKKNYASKVIMQEGAKVEEKDSLDIKGLTIKKSNVNKNLGNQMQDILEEDILEAKNINIKNVLGKLSDLEKAIGESLDKGEVYYAKPDKCNEPSTYKTPFQIQSVRGIYAWNCLYPDKEITFPAQVNMIKLTCPTIFDLKNLSEIEPEFYNIIDEKIFGNENFKQYGFTVIAIPKTENKIPEWIIPFIDKDTMIYDGLNNFNKILESISVKTIETKANVDHYSNIIDF